MKTLLSISFFFFFVSSVFSQQFVRNDARWVYNFHGYFGYGYTIIAYEQDTIIDNRLVKQFGRYHTQKMYDIEDTFKVRLGAIFLYEDQGLVEYSMRGAPFQARFNFNIELGDTLGIRDFFSSNDSLPYATRYISVIDTFFLDVGDRQLSSKEIEYKTVYANGRDDFIRFDTLVQYLGFLNQYIDPDDARHRAVDGGEGGFLRCYSNDELGIVQSPIRGNMGFYAYDCNKFDISTSSRNSITSNIISSYPNPVVDAWEIDNTGNEALESKFIDVNGRTLFQLQLKPGKNEFSIGQLPAGLYFLMIEGKAVEKILKQ